MFRLIKWIYIQISNKMRENPVDKLRSKGAVIGENVHIYDGGGCIIDYDYAYLIQIGNNVTISCSTLLLHDASIKKELKYTKFGKIAIGDNVFIGAGSIVLPNVRIGNKVIIGAGTVVSKDIPDNSVAVGNPVRIIGTYDSYMNKCSDWIAAKPHINQNNMFEEINALQDELTDWIFVK